MVDPKLFAEAVWAGDLPAVEALLADGADPNAADGDRQPPLHLAIEPWDKVPADYCGRLLRLLSDYCAGLRRL